MAEEIYPPIMVLVHTFEFYDNIWHLTLTHSFYGNTVEEATQTLNAHRTTDSFFDNSFSGTFNYKGKVLTLKNSKILVYENGIFIKEI